MSVKHQNKLFLQVKTAEGYEAGRKRQAGMITGYLHTQFNVPDLGTTMRIQHYVDTVANSRNVDTALLGPWVHGYVGRFKSFVDYYAMNYEGVNVTQGHIYTLENQQLSQGGFKEIRKNIACWIAAQDECLISFEVHFPNGRIWQSKNFIEVDKSKTQYECGITDLMNIMDQQDMTLVAGSVSNNLIKMSNAKGETTIRLEEPRHANNSLSVEQERLILEMFKQKVKGKDIAVRFKISATKVSFLKTKFKTLGWL